MAAEDDRAGAAVEGDQDTVVERGEDKIIRDRRGTDRQVRHLRVPFDLARRALESLHFYSERAGGRKGHRTPPRVPACVRAAQEPPPPRAPSRPRSPGTPARLPLAAGFRTS